MWLSKMHNYNHDTIYFKQNKKPVLQQKAQAVNSINYSYHQYCSKQKDKKKKD